VKGSGLVRTEKHDCMNHPSQKFPYSGGGSIGSASACGCGESGLVEKVMGYGSACRGGGCWGEGDRAQVITSSEASPG
jgi:hypothetical protein